MNFLWDNSLAAFLVLTLFLGGSAAWMSGRAIAISWRPVKQIIIYMMLLTAAVRFLNFALYEGTIAVLLLLCRELCDPARDLMAGLPLHPHQPDGAAVSLALHQGFASFLERAEQLADRQKTECDEARHTRFDIDRT